MRILIGACGGLTGFYLVKRYKNNFFLPVEILGFDENSDNPTRFFLDEFIVSPSFKEEELFIEFLIETLKENKVDAYIPTYSKETMLVSKWQSLIREQTDTRFIVSDITTVDALENKDAAYYNLGQIGIPTPQTYNGFTVADIKFPIISKPKTGSGSKGVAIINDKDEFDFFWHRDKERIFVEYLEGEECTVDAVFGYDNRLIAYNQRKRLKIMGGAAIISKNDFSVDVGEYIQIIGRHFKIRGACNFQFFKNGNNIWFTDVNLRFPSGGLPLSVESGVDIPEILIKILLGEPVDGYHSDRQPRTMYRYFEEIFEVK